MFQVDLKTLLGLILPNQYSHVVMGKNQGRFLGYIISQATPIPSMFLLYSNIILYDGSIDSTFLKLFCMAGYIEPVPVLHCFAGYFVLKKNLYKKPKKAKKKLPQLGA